MTCYFCLFNLLIVKKEYFPVVFILTNVNCEIYHLIADLRIST